MASIHWMSIMDLVQMIANSEGLLRTLFGSSQRDKKDDTHTSSASLSDEGMPTNLLSAKLSRKDESFFENLVMVHLTRAEQKIVNACIAEMARRDKEDSGNRVDSFQLGVLIMPNKLAEGIMPQQASQTPRTPRRRNRGESVKLEDQGTPQSTSKDPRFTDDDARIKYLKSLVKNIQEEGGQDEAIKKEIDQMQDRKFIATGDLLKEIQARAESLKNRTGYAIRSLVLRVFLPAKTSEAVLRRHPEPAENATPETKKKWQDEVIQELDIHLQQQNEHRRRNPPKITYPPRYWWIIGGMTFFSVLGIVLINILK